MEGHLQGVSLRLIDLTEMQIPKYHFGKVLHSISLTSVAPMRDAQRGL